MKLLYIGKQEMFLTLGVTLVCGIVKALVIWKVFFRSVKEALTSVIIASNIFRAWLLVGCTGNMVFNMLCWDTPERISFQRLSG